MRTEEQIIGDMIEVKFGEGQSFLVVRETLSRIGIVNIEKRTIYQSVHIFQKRGRYYLAHFKTLLELDGLHVDYTSEDDRRLVDIACMISRWGLVNLIGNYQSSGLNNFRVLKSDEFRQYTHIVKYTIGKFKKRDNKRPLI